MGGNGGHADAFEGKDEGESPSLVLVINDTKLLMPLCQVN
jgi:hypothetical protein